MAEKAALYSKVLSTCYNYGERQYKLMFSIKEPFKRGYKLRIPKCSMESLPSGTDQETASVVVS